MSGIDHLHIGRSTSFGQFSEQPLPDIALGPTHKVVVDRSVRAVFRRAVAPTTPTLDHMQGAADDPAIVDPRFTAHVLGQQRLDPLPLLVVQLIKIAPHVPLPCESAIISESPSDSGNKTFIGF